MKRKTLTVNPVIVCFFFNIVFWGLIWCWVARWSPCCSTHSVWFCYLTFSSQDPVCTLMAKHSTCRNSTLKKMLLFCFFQTESSQNLLNRILHQVAVFYNTVIFMNQKLGVTTQSWRILQSPPSYAVKCVFLQNILENLNIFFSFQISYCVFS